MKNVLAVLCQLLLFAVFTALFFAGGILGLFHLDPFGAPHWFVSHPTVTSTRYFVPSGLFLMTLLWLLVLGIEGAVKKLRSVGLWTSMAYVVALIIGLLLKFGWATV